MRSRRAAILISLLGVNCAQAQTQQHKLTSIDQKEIAHLPEGPGKALVMQYCAGACHEMSRIVESQGTHAEWITRIRRMIRRGAVIPPESIEPTATYLAAALPPRVPAQSAQTSPIAVTFGEAAVRPIQIWVRAAGMTTDAQTLRVDLPAAEAEWVKSGQRVRVFAMRSRSSMLQGRVIGIDSSGDKHQADVRLVLPAQADRYLVEIITERAAVLCIPNEAIIEEGDRRVVYVQGKSGDFEPRPIETGMQGESFTEVVKGLEPSQRVVTFGSFFIDAEYKLKSGQ